MGKPIAGQNKFPFQNGGFLVDSAKIDGRTFSKELYIYKQSSSFMFDLIEATTGEIFRDVHIAWLDENGAELDYYQTPLYIASVLPERTFARKVQSIKRNIYGFLVMVHENKVKVSTGDYIYYDRDTEMSLAGVTLSPQRLTINKGDIASFDIMFFPPDFENKTGNWTVKDTKIARAMSQVSLDDVRSTMTFEALSVGETPVYFTPNANEMITATAILNVIDNEPEEKLDIQLLRYKSGYTTPERYMVDSYGLTRGAEFQLKLVPSYDFKLTELPEIKFNSDLVEFIGTDDFVVYNFRVKDDAHSYEFPIEINIPHHKETINARFVGGIYFKPHGPFSFYMPKSCRVGQTIYARSIVPESDFTWVSSDESILSVVGPCEFKGVGEGTAIIYAHQPDSTPIENKVIVSNKCADYFKVVPVAGGLIEPGSVVNYKVEIFPPECAEFYPTSWKIDPATSNSPEYLSIDENGVFKYTREMQDMEFENTATLRPFDEKLTQKYPFTSLEQLYITDYPAIQRYIGYSSTDVTGIYGETQTFYVQKDFSEPVIASFLNGYSRDNLGFELSCEGEGEIFAQRQRDGYSADYWIENAYLIVTGLKEGRGTITYKLKGSSGHPVEFKYNIIVY